MKIRHAFTGYTYELVGDGQVRVVDPATDREGLFDEKGRWQEGELTYADLHMCGAVGGRKAASQLGARAVPAANPPES